MREAAAIVIFLIAAAIVLGMVIVFLPIVYLFVSIL